MKFTKNITLIALSIVLLGLVSCSKSRERRMKKSHLSNIARPWVWNGEGSDWQKANPIHSPVYHYIDTVIPVMRIDDNTVEFMGSTFQLDYEPRENFITYNGGGGFTNKKLQFDFVADTIYYFEHMAQSSSSRHITLSGKSK